MKKNISINISGIIFHIEEDGYEILRKYLDSINRYFSSFEDSSEILADIESRIAEILLSKLSEGKQVVTAEDINSLMATMGSVSDFKAAEDQEFAAGEPKQEKKQEWSPPKSEPAASKKLFRDEKRKILGGVCAGLGHYFNIDPVWPRLLIALLAFATYGGFVVAYFILWFLLPVSATLEEETTVKKMFRDTEKRVVGGVASGLAAFFNLDITLVRVLFIVFSFFGGLGVVIYVIFWIALPEAKTITEKIQMQGEPVTLSNIESNVKKGLNEKDGEPESPLVKVILFPFRIIAAIIDGLGKALGPMFILLVDILRIGIGLVITLTGVTLILSFILVFCVAVGLIHVPDSGVLNDWYFNAPNFPINAFRQAFPLWTVAFAFVAVIIPALMVALLGSSIISKKIVFGPVVGWSLFVAFFVSAGFLSFSVPRIVMSFKEKGEHREEKLFTIQGIPVLSMNEAGLEDYEVTDLRLRGWDGKDLKLVQHFEAQGNTRRIASENAQMVTYNVAQTDSTLTFDSNITFKDNAVFRAQRLDMDLYIPYDRPFYIDDRLWRLIDNNSDYRYYRYTDGQAMWKINEYGTLECANCHEDNSSFEEQNDDDFDSSRETRSGYELRDFTALDINGYFNVVITQSSEYSVDITGKPSDTKLYDISVDGGTLVIRYDRDRNGRRRWNDNKRVKIRIRMPELRDLEAAGAGKITFSDFREDDTEITLRGAVIADGQLESENLEVNLNGTSYLDLTGKGRYLNAHLSGVSGLRAYGYEVKEAYVKASGASIARVYATESIEMDKNMASSVSYQGEPNIVKDH
jgi:phage shock protein PspC (stress-responsive transcriptional regulator)